MALGGACELYSLDPDLVTLGRLRGGGLPVGAWREVAGGGQAGAAGPGVPGGNAERESSGDARQGWRRS